MAEVVLVADRSGILIPFRVTLSGREQLVLSKRKEAFPWLTAVLVQREANFYGSELFATSLGEGYGLAGEHEKATKTLGETLAIIERWGMRFQIGAAYRILGEMALLSDLAQAAIHFEHSITTLDEIRAEPELSLAYAGYGRPRVQQGDVIQARSYLNQALEIFERLGILKEPEKVREMLFNLPET